MRHTRPRSPTLALALLTTVAIPARAQPPTVRDSAGIVIVENRVRQPQPLLPERVADAPSVQIGARDGAPEYQFNQIIAVTRLPSGSIAVADGGSSEIRVFDERGRFLRRMGRKGQGPGEFQFLQQISALPGDTIVARDAAGRLTVFDERGAVVRTMSLSAPFPVEVRGGGRFSSVVPVTMLSGTFADGSFVAYRWKSSGTPPDGRIERDTMIVVRFSPDGKHLNDVGRFPGFERRRTSGGTTRTGSLMTVSFRIQGVPFSRETFVQIGDAVVYSGDGDASYEVHVHTPGGPVSRIIRKLQPNREVTADVIAGHRREIAGQRGTPSRPASRADLDAADYPATLPAYAGFQVDAGGRLWVQEYPVPGDSVPRWSVFNRDGAFLGMIDTPPRLRIFEIGRTHVLGVWRDELDVEFVRVYPIVGAPRQ